MNKTTFGILTILFNQIGVPCFIQGDTKTGILRIICNLCCILTIVNAIMGIILGIQVLKMTDEEYNAAFGTITKGIPNMKKAEEKEEVQE